MIEIETLPITDDMSELEKFVRQEAMNYVNSTCFLSSISDHHKNIDSVVEKGKAVTPYVVALYKEKGEYASDNMFTHFFLLVMQRLYGSPFQGYVGMEMCVRYYLKAYEYDCLDMEKNEDNTEKAIAFLTDLFNLDDDTEIRKLVEAEIEKQLEKEYGGSKESVESV